MSDHAELDDILTGAAAPTGDPTPEPEAPESTEPETPAEAAPPAAEKPPETREDSKPPPGFVPHQALAEERRKRQEYERELQALREKAQQPKPNLFEDPEKWEAALEERVQRMTAEAEARAQARFIALAEQDARSRYSDYDEMVQVFADVAKETPALLEEARSASNPVEFVYKTARNLKTVREAGSLEELIKQAEARGEERARQALSKPKVEIPSSLTEIAGVKGETSPKWEGPKALDSILPEY